MQNETDNQQNTSRGNKRDDRSNASSHRHDERSNSQPQRSNDRSVGVLIKDMMMELTSLVRNEAELAKAEVSEKVSKVQTGAVSMVVAAILLLVGLIGLMHAAINGLALIWPMWLSALVVGGVIVVIGFIALAMGRSKLKAANMNTPRMSREMDKDRAFVQEQTQ